MNYKHYPNRPGDMTAEFVREEYQRLVGRIDAAEASDDSAEWLALFEEWNSLKSFVGSEGSRRSHALSKNMNDEEAEAKEKYFREEIAPVFDEGESALVRALLDSRHRTAVAERYGEHLLRLLETSVEPLAPVNSPLRVKVSDLVNQYDKIIAAGEVEVKGETVTLAVARSLQGSEDRETRKEAFIAWRNWFLEHRDAIADLFDRIVKLRHQMAVNLGHENYIRLGYLGMGRTDYGVAEAAEFRRNIRRYAVPLMKKLDERLAAEHGTGTLKPWDSTYSPSLNLPSGIAPVETQIERAQRIFDKLSPVLAAHFRRMREENLIDLENRRGKRAGAYCTSFSDEGRVAILCNSTGDEDDVRTLMHEMGHAFQGWESQPIEAVDLQWPTSDACEVHSMGMEYLSMKYMEEFFASDDAAKFRRNRWKQAVSLVCYIAVVDEFQHWLYENPNATPDERDAAWNRIADVYQPGVDYTGYEHYRALRWYAQGHIFWSPFYYIDYAIAETGAMQLGLMDAKDSEQAMHTYLDLCRMGGTKSVLDIFTSAGLRSPFDPELMHDLMVHAAGELGVEDYQPELSA